MKQPIGIKVIPALVIGLFSGYAAASGFQLQNQAGSGNGNAFAGAAAAAEDSSTIFFNPAGMTNLPEGQNVSLSATLLNRSIKFNDTGSSIGTTAPFTTAQWPLPSGNGGNGGGLALLPAGYWSYSIAPNWRVGVGVGPTFGNTTEYDFNFTGRNAGYYFEMEQVNINPSIAYKVNEMVSLGVGVNFAHNTSHFKQGNPLVLGAAGYQQNNYLEVKAKDWAYGYNLGAMFQISPNTRIGLTYRSTLTFNLEGHESWGINANGIPPAIPALVDADIKGTLKTPANYSLAAEHKLNDKWEFLGDVTWTNWSVLSTLFVNNQQTGAPLQKLPYNFRDTWRIGLGGNYQYDAAWKLRFGMAYDKTPVGSAAGRTMTLPDASRTWLSFGAKYALNQASSLDFGYTHIFFANAATARAVTTGYPGPETVRQTIRGDFTTTADILSLQYNHTF